jgi:hypothetical protein
VAGEYLGEGSWPVPQRDGGMDGPGPATVAPAYPRTEGQTSPVRAAGSRP